MIRLVPNHAPAIRRSEKVHFTFDGQSYEGHVGESLVSALTRAGHLSLRGAPVDGAPRGAFCCMGLCQECAVIVDGQVVEACRTDVSADLVVERVR
ncbi:2Fe-2S iron-sulfur cluster binding domain-containing protein [Poseidonocella pacifica]|uniref:2Fe-2S iron-sulfur cluster binding domain-containing protein n=1 Tax=Poseidonocella pacifica TaxID=871651 RepID=A0A1I0UXT7_9RHOB|nr:2Fe-2S iron-sulfur cluster binding domain-containing protein [Poseidonocella pacifica]